MLPISAEAPLRLLPVWRSDPGMQGRDEPNDEALWIELPYVRPQGVLRLRVRAGATIPPSEGAPLLRVALQCRVRNQAMGLGVATVPIDAPVERMRDYEIEIPLDLIDFPYTQFERAKYIGVRLINDYAPIADRDLAKQQAAKAELDRARKAAQQAGQKPPAGEPAWPWEEPLLVIDHVEVSTPGGDEWPARRLLALTAPGDGIADERERARAIIAAVAAKAWRRAVAADELDGFVALYARRRQAGEGRDAALMQPLVAVLVSPHATHLVECKAEKPAPLAGDELARRLAMFLWGAGPDRALLDAAPRLREQSVLRAQTLRLLDDPRSEVFLRELLRQWQALDRIRKDPIEFRLQTTTPRLGMGNDVGALLLAQRREQRLKDDLAEEPLRFALRLLREDRPLTELIASDSVVVNDRLAAYYGIPGVAGDAFRAMPAPVDRRQGLLTMAGIIAAASRGEHESVIHRGVYLLARILGDPPGAPAGDVQPLAQQSKDDPKRAKLTLRQRLALHTEVATCQLCHRKIDILGFAWAGFDEFGRPAAVKAVKGAAPQPIDAAGSLPDGRVFADLVGFVGRIAETDTSSRYCFGAVFTRQLAGYALGRRLGLADDAMLQGLVAQAQREGWKLRALVCAIVASDAFTHG